MDNQHPLTEEKPSFMHVLAGKLLCFIGWHKWTWKFERGSTIYLDAPPPAHAKCSKCHKVYGQAMRPTTTQEDN